MSWNYHGAVVEKTSEVGGWSVRLVSFKQKYWLLIRRLQKLAVDSRIEKIEQTPINVVISMLPHRSKYAIRNEALKDRDIEGPVRGPETSNRHLMIA